VTGSHARVAVARDEGATSTAADIAAALPGCTIVTVADQTRGPHEMATPTRFSTASLDAALTVCDVLLLDIAQAATLSHLVDIIIASRGVSRGASRRRGDVLVVDVSPIAPTLARECAQRLDAAGIHYTGAALVRRGPDGHVAYVDAGADEGALALLGRIADPVLCVGDVGSSKLVRILDATMAAVNATVTAEALSISSRLGLSDADVVARVSLGSGAHAGLATALDGERGPSVDRACDDLNMALDLGRVHRRSMFFASAALSALRGSSGMGLGHEPLPAVRRWFERSATNGNGA
jgi:3-hydroxyisobutyrate dehydrogenase-like beta-hydroxyacid dehydrogenase